MSDGQRMKQRTRAEEIQAVCNLVKTMVQAVVDDEDAVDMHLVEGQANIVIEVVINDRDMGYAMGQNGRTVEAMRTILNAMCKKLRIRYAFTVLSRDEVTS